MAAKLLVIAAALVPFATGLWCLLWPHRVDQCARDERYASIQGSFLLRILPTAVNVWFIRLLGLGAVYLAGWLAYTALTRI